MSKLLQNKNAIILRRRRRYRTRGRTGLAREGATVFLSGRTPETLDGVAAKIDADGGTAHVAVVDALDDVAVNDHVQAVVDQGGTVDVCFNLISRGDVQGTPLLETDVEDLMRPISVGARSDFVTARAAARHMVRQRSGVILMISSASGAVLKGSAEFQMGGTGPADAASESFMQ